MEDVARRFLAAGLSVVPIRPDGSKAPAVPSWKQFQDGRMSPGDVGRYFQPGSGIGVIGGPVSGGLEVLDFDRPGAFETWREIVAQQDPELINKLPVVATPAGGYHVYYRSEAAEGCGKLAEASTPFARGSSTGTVIVETKARGGYVIAPPSPAACHASGIVYRQVSGPGLPRVPTISRDERDLLVSAARSMNEAAKETRIPPEHEGKTNGEMRPGDDYNARAGLDEWRRLLRGWTWLYQTREGVWHLRRPGKEGRGTSATLGYGGANKLHVFSTNAPDPFSEGTYSIFCAKALVEHGGDWRSCVRALAAEGYGTAQATAEGAQTTAQATAEKPKRRLKGLTYAELEAMWKDASVGGRIETGIDELDVAIGGGLPVGQVTTVIGNTGVGKSEFVRQLSRNIADEGHRVIRVDVELGARRLVDRDVSQLTEIPSSKLHAELSDGQTEMVAEAFQELCGLSIITIPCLGAPTLDELKDAIVDAMHMGTPTGDKTALILDSGQRLASGAASDDQRLRNQGLWEWAEGIAKSLDVAVVITSEQKRSQKGGATTPEELLHSGAETRAIEYVSDVVIGLIEEGTAADMVAGPADEAFARSVKILIAKVRDGRVGYLGHELVFAGPCWDMQVRAVDDKLGETVFAHIREHGPVSINTIHKTLKKRKQAVSYKVKQLEAGGLVVYTGGGYMVRQLPKSAGTHEQKKFNDFNT